MENKIQLFNLDKLRIAITNTCNLSCFYCHNEGQKLNCKAKFLPLSYIQTMVKWLQKNHVSAGHINITGGEPMLHPDLKEIIKELRKLTPKIRLNTNATLLTKENIVELHELGVESLKIGIDTVYAKQTKPNIYTTKTNVDQMLENIKFASTLMKVVLNTVVTKFNYKDIDKIVEFAKQTNLKRIKIIKLNDVNSRDYNDKEQIAADFKTNQIEGDWYYYFFTKYVTQAVKTENSPHKGRTDLWMKDGFEIRLCDDVCSYSACGNMYTEIDSNGDLVICQRKAITAPLSFDGDFDTVSQKIISANSKMCNALTGVNLYNDYKPTTI